MSIHKDTTVINEPDNTIEFNHLIISPGHAIPWYEGKDPNAVYDEKNWIGLFGYGPGSNEQGLYIEHIAAAINEANRDPHAMLVFSGGYTRNPELFWEKSLSQPFKLISEARGYYNVARLLKEFNTSLAHRIRLEEFARDSYENCLNTLSLFKSETGKMPEKVSACGFIFKKFRYDFHIEMIKRKFEVDFEFKYIGVNNSPNNAQYRIYPDSLIGEAKTITAFSIDPHGEGAELMAKKVGRDFLPHRTLPFTLLK